MGKITSSLELYIIIILGVEALCPVRIFVTPTMIIVFQESATKPAQVFLRYFHICQLIAQFTVNCQYPS